MSMNYNSSTPMTIGNGEDLQLYQSTSPIGAGTMMASNRNSYVDDTSSQIAINANLQQDVLADRVKVNILVKSRAILLKTLAEERQRYCIWILIIVMSILLTFVPSIISLIITLVTMDPDAGPKLIRVGLINTYSRDSMYETAYTSFYSSLRKDGCCNKRDDWSGYTIECPIADFNFLLSYQQGTNENVLGYVNLYNESAGLLDSVYHPCNRETPTSLCKTSPTFIKDKSIDPSEILKSNFKYNETIKKFNSIINVKKSENVNSNLQLNLEITSYYKQVYNQLISLILKTVIESLPDSNINPITHTTLRFNNDPSTSSLMALGTTDFIPLITLAIIPICLSLLFPVFIDSFAQDRSGGMMEIIELYGITSTLHAVVKTCFFYGIYVIYVVAQIVVGLAFQNPFFLKNNAGIYITALLIWGITIISIANVISVFKVKSGYFIGFCLLIFGFLGSIVAIFVFSNGIMPYYLLLIPSIAFLRILLLMILPSMLVPIEGNYGEQVVIAYAFLIGVTLIIALAVPVANLVILLFKKLYKLLKAKKLSQETMKLKDNFNKNYSTDAVATPHDVDKVADDTVEREVQYVLNNTNMENNVIEVRQLTKRYGSKVAVNNVTFCIPRGICFGLLGNNGAGKTTTVNCILGLEFPYEGICTLSGKDINSTDSNILATRIGCVHQFDRFFGITVLDQLKFFAAIKGIPRKLIEKHIDEILQDVGLTEARRRNCKDLSGGMQRRLSLAIAMIGKPELLILDEVTGGLDPLSAHGIHMILKKYMEDKNRAILTLTHSMEETEILCDKVGILVNGEMKTIGTLHELKTKYGKGYKLYVQTSSTEYNEVARNYVQTSLVENGIPPNLISHNETFANRLEFRIGNHQNDSKQLLETLFKVMTRKEAKHAFIVDWTCTMASLEEVFIRKVKWQYENDTVQQ
ncbi:predicted protein [Naegleria gruberi]|uniref:Predicted protein n=1 Tax=Naegleria gruberi TaxID=5762 RepID=D2W101_NAEGR|nr:uncharacterized protein NAEGRDRAFT_75040 [Naegleria gruberi]EFC37231.1 predicted protein [Naegleria gruberi]|eukprot:XP_002669975.1 predicted protein [Naegleria gruberi strain NEG-M]